MMNKILDMFACRVETLKVVNIAAGTIAGVLVDVYGYGDYHKYVTVTDNGDGTTTFDCRVPYKYNKRFYQKECIHWLLCKK